MQKGTDNGKKGSIISAVVLIVLFSALIMALLFPILTENFAPLAVVVLLGVYCLMILGIILGIIAALRQRIREIEKGELEEAKKY